jgi:nucleoid-associated protein YgaU
MFFKGSRYQKVGTDEIEHESGRVVKYKMTRITPRARIVSTHVVRSWERLDHIASAVYADPTAFWRICDANDALWPEDMQEPGTVLLVPSEDD